MRGNPLVPNTVCYRFADAVAAAGQARADFRAAAAKFLEEYGDLQDDPNIWKAVMECDKQLAAAHPDASYEARLEVVGQTARKKFGSPKSRVIKEMQAQRRKQQAPNPFESEVEEEPSEFERERAEDISSAIDQLRKARAGIPLEEFKRRRPGQTSDECAEDCAKQGP